MCSYTHFFNLSQRKPIHVGAAEIHPVVVKNPDLLVHDSTAIPVVSIPDLELDAIWITSLFSDCRITQIMRNRKMGDETLVFWVGNPPAPLEGVQPGCGAPLPSLRHEFKLFPKLMVWSSA